MRLIGHFPSHIQAIRFSTFLASVKIENTVEKTAHESGDVFAVWIHDEDQISRAFDYYQDFVLRPEDPKFALKQNFGKKTKPLQFSVHKKVSLFRYKVTYTILLLCSLLFFWNGVQQQKIRSQIGEEGFWVTFFQTPLQKSLFFDDPKAMDTIEKFLINNSIYSLDAVKKKSIEIQKNFHQLQDTPFWKGAVDFFLQRRDSNDSSEDIPMFEKIQQGEIWRFFSPAFLHKDIVHLCFNMIWLLLLGRQIEDRLKMPRFICLVLALSALSNTAQYLMGGSAFLGFSGVLTGLAGFIWSRQRKAPWEGYPLQKTMLFVIGYLIVLPFVISSFCLLGRIFGITDFNPSSIANTAHITGALFGFVLGQFSFFSRRIS